MAEITPVDAHRGYFYAFLVLPPLRLKREINTPNLLGGDIDMITIQKRHANYLNCPYIVILHISGRQFSLAARLRLIFI
jgi:hypothetical protein